VSEDRLKIAVFIDFDNIEIGVKTTLNARFDVGGVLEAIKERGEIVAKSAYGDWTRATEYGRSMSQHAIHMVQRNLTPGGDKNGADINLALDALEMAFTHNHINAFVIVGGDSDFITLVEKLKQYDRKVFVVGGRAFTSHVMQRNCTEFIAYEDITGVASRGGRQSERGGRAAGEANLASAMPLLRRALKLLADREVLPQLGLLKSTLLQLDSTFSERAYGVSSFRDFVQKLAKAGFVTLKGTDRSFHVELREAGEAAAAGTAGPAAAAPAPPPSRGRSTPAPAQAEPEGPPEGPEAVAAETEPAGAEEDAGSAATPPDGEGPPRLGPVEGFRILQAAFARPGVSPRFPMYVRQVKQFVRQVDDSFDERRYGFTGMVDALRYGQREGLFRLDRDRQGVVRVYPGLRYPAPGGVTPQAGEGGAVLEAEAQERAVDDVSPAGGGETFAVSEEANGRPEADAEAGPGEPREAVIESVTYDVVTHVDADTGVIDVARHGDPLVGGQPGVEAPAGPAAAEAGPGRRKPSRARSTGGRRSSTAKAEAEGTVAAPRPRGAGAGRTGARRRKKAAGSEPPVD
jgi:uncharacterized LabA/DUF88 family protein